MENENDLETLSNMSNLDSTAGEGSENEAMENISDTSDELIVDRLKKIAEQPEDDAQELKPVNMEVTNEGNDDDEDDLRSTDSNESSKDYKEQYHEFVEGCRVEWVDVFEIDIMTDKRQLVRSNCYHHWLDARWSTVVVVDHGTIGCYVGIDDPGSLPDHWSHRIGFTFEILNTKDETIVDRKNYITLYTVSPLLFITMQTIRRILILRNIA